ncbi:MAG: pirin family protein [Egibacteraceae bacterium]
MPATLVHLTPADYHEIRPEDFNAPGLRAYESIGPYTSLRASGPLLMVHDGRFDANRGIGYHPHRGMERLFYILAGTVSHDDARNGIRGRMDTGDLGILTEGALGMVHSEWNVADEPGRAYILVYPNDPLAPTARFDAVRDADAPRLVEAGGVVTKQLITRGSGRLGGDVREFADSLMAAGSGVALRIGENEGALLFVVDGEVTVSLDAQTVIAGADDTVLAPPAAEPRTVRVQAREDRRVLRAVHGAGFGPRR